MCKPTKTKDNDDFKGNWIDWFINYGRNRTPYERSLPNNPDNERYKRIKETLEKI